MNFSRAIIFELTFPFAIMKYTKKKTCELHSEVAKNESSASADDLFRTKSLCL